MRKKWMKRVLPVLAVVLVLAAFAGIFYKSTTEHTKEDSLKEGTYFPEFSFTGGTGKVIITCEQVVIENGQATATIVFDSPHYTWVKIDGAQYDNETPGADVSTFEIPVNPEGTTEITAETTAMSVAHEITYELLISISGNAGEASEEEREDETQLLQLNKTNIEEIPEISGLTYSHSPDIEYAECFRIYCYEDGYEVIRIDDGRDYLLIPENGEIPQELPENYVILEKPLDNIYLAATSAMAMFDEIGALDQIRLSGTDADGWYVEDAKAAMEAGEILFAGKYSTPDYELLVSEGCSLAIESTMILHSPEVQEKLEETGIPVLIDRASYENHPLGRTEWIKVYGALTDKTEEAQAAFEEQKNYVLALEDFENTEKTVAFFYINQNGLVVTRKSSDYIPAMIELAGGRYIFEDLGDSENASSAVNLTMEEFYASAKDADYLVYNGTIDNPLNSVKDLISKSDLFEDFKAVKEGNVWSTDKYLYQAANENGQMIQDFHVMLTDDSAENLRFIYRLK